MTDALRPLPTVIGTTENTLRALLLRRLAGTGLDGYQDWAALNLISALPEGTTAPDAVRGPLRLEPGAAADLLDRLATRGLLTRSGGTHTLSADGAALLARLRPDVAATTARLTEGLPGPDVATALRVLDQVRARAEEELAGLRPGTDAPGGQLRPGLPG